MAKKPISKKLGDLFDIFGNNSGSTNLRGYSNKDYSGSIDEPEYQTENIGQQNYNINLYQTVLEALSNFKFIMDDEYNKVTSLTTDDLNPKYGLLPISFDDDVEKIINNLNLNIQYLDVNTDILRRDIANIKRLNNYNTTLLQKNNEILSNIRTIFYKQTYSDIENRMESIKQENKLDSNKFNLYESNLLSAFDDISVMKSNINTLKDEIDKLKNNSQDIDIDIMKKLGKNPAPIAGAGAGLLRKILPGAGAATGGILAGGYEYFFGSGGVNESINAGILGGLGTFGGGAIGGFITGGPVGAIVGAITGGILGGYAADPLNKQEIEIKLSSISILLDKLQEGGKAGGQNTGGLNEKVIKEITDLRNSYRNNILPGEYENQLKELETRFEFIKRTYNIEGKKSVYIASPLPGGIPSVGHHITSQTTLEQAQTAAVPYTSTSITQNELLRLQQEQKAKEEADEQRKLGNRFAGFDSNKNYVISVPDGIIQFNAKKIIGLEETIEGLIKDAGKASGGSGSDFIGSTLGGGASGGGGSGDVGGGITPSGGAIQPSTPAAPGLTEPGVGGFTTSKTFLESSLESGKFKTDGGLGRFKTSRSGDTNLDINQKNRVDPNNLRNYIIDKIKDSKLNGFVPSDGEKYGIKKGTPEEWANYFVGLAKHESDLNVNSHGDIGQFGGYGSRGLFQLSPQDAINYGLNDKKPFSLEQLRDPKTNTDTAITITERLVTKNGSIRGGAGKYWNPIKKEGWTPGQGRDKNLPWNEWSNTSRIQESKVNKIQKDISPILMSNEENSNFGGILPNIPGRYTEGILEPSIQSTSGSLFSPDITIPTRLSLSDQKDKLESGSFKSSDAINSRVLETQKTAARHRKGPLDADLNKLVSTVLEETSQKYNKELRWVVTSGSQTNEKRQEGDPISARPPGASPEHDRGGAGDGYFEIKGNDGKWTRYNSKQYPDMTNDIIKNFASKGGRSVGLYPEGWFHLGISRNNPAVYKDSLGLGISESFRKGRNEFIQYMKDQGYSNTGALNRKFIQESYDKFLKEKNKQPEPNKSGSENITPPNTPTSRPVEPETDKRVELLDNNKQNIQNQTMMGSTNSSGVTQRSGTSVQVAARFSLDETTKKIKELRDISEKIQESNEPSKSNNNKNYQQNDYNYHSPNPTTAYA